MLTVLVAVRDFLLAMALAWVGITIEQRVESVDHCAGDACQVQPER